MGFLFVLFFDFLFANFLSIFHATHPIAVIHATRNIPLGPMNMSLVVGFSGIQYFADKMTIISIDQNNIRTTSAPDISLDRFSLSSLSFMAFQYH